MKTTRRDTLSALMALPLAAVASRAIAAVKRTPSAAEGPFYPRPGMRFADTDANLVKIESVVAQAGGEVIRLKGRVFDGTGQPAEGARVEIWQCDANGRYLHTGDRGGRPRDPAFQGYGHFITDADGVYEFRTIKPVPYPGRTPHIHVKVIHSGREFTTQFYIADHPLNLRDGLFRRMTTREQRAVSMNFEDGSSGTETTIDIFL